MRVAFFSFLFLISSLSHPIFADQSFKAEVMELEGQVELVKRSAVRPTVLKDGDLLEAGDAVKTGDNSFVDIAYDGNWKNLVRVEKNTKATLRSLYPGEIALERGGVFAKLGELPEGSKFEVQMPTAIVAVRGTEFRAVYGERGSEVFNYSDSEVYVYGLDEKGNISKQYEPVVLLGNQKTEVYRREEFHSIPHSMTLADRSEGTKVLRHLEQRVERFEKEGRKGKAPDLQSIRVKISEMKEKGVFENKGVWPPARQKNIETRTIAAAPPGRIPRGEAKQELPPVRKDVPEKPTAGEPVQQKTETGSAQTTERKNPPQVRRQQLPPPNNR